jgi:hypothetical protein
MGTKLEPRQGITAGLTAGLGMLALWLAGAHFWGPGADVLLMSLGDVILPASSTPALLMVGGVIVHLIVSVLLGLLYAVSLDRLDARDTLIVSTFYGFTIWVVAIVILRHWVHVDAVLMSRSWWGFVTFLAFGFLLGVYANLFGKKPVD